MCRDDEIQRLTSYAKGLGLTVNFASKGDVAAEWYLDNSGIIIYKNNNDSKLQTVLSLIHELGHAKHNLWEKNGKVDPKFEKALDHIDEAEELEIDSNKKQRKVILNNEIAGTRYWHEIYTETKMRFPVWKLEAQMEFDTWQYEVFYEKGSYPKSRERKQKIKEIRKKHRNKNG